MSLTSSTIIEASAVGRFSYTFPTSTNSYPPNPSNKAMTDLDNKPPGYQRSIIILIAFSCLVLLGTVFGSALYWYRYRAKWRMEEKEAFEIVYPSNKAQVGNSRGFEGDGVGDGEGEGGEVVKSRWSVRGLESAMVVVEEKEAKKAFSGHQVSNNSINDNNRPQSLQLPQQQLLQQRQANEMVEKEEKEVVKIEIAPGQSNALEAERWMEEDRQRYQELSELIKSPILIQQHEALLLQQPFQPQSPVGRSLQSQSLQSQQQILLQQEFLLQQYQHLQEQHQQEQHQRQQEQLQQQQHKEQQGTPTRKPWHLPLGLYDQLFRKKSRAALSRASSKWEGGMDSLSPTLSTSHPPSPSLLTLSAAPSAVSMMPFSVGDGVRPNTSHPPLGLSRLTIVNTPLYPSPPSVTPPTATPVRPFRIKIGEAHYCLTPDSTTPSPSSSSAPRSSSSTVVASSSLQLSLRSAPINMDSPTQPWKNVSEFAFPTPLLTSSLSISDGGGGVRTPQTVSPIENGPIPRGVSKRTVHACVMPPQAEDGEEAKDGGEKEKERELEESVMSPTLPLSSTQFRRFYDLEID
ncbi:hypothetical protein KI688_011844 [Linnemannia hyalina]|uniref:Uncharacterized protein n=1 Tax=Linnemannia hyalina TaxID=64524 RepID=A0A9P7XYK6_9FUNG|nr:hypothetical protein KI688_011844 [Linnemannia hyalina]